METTTGKFGLELRNDRGDTLVELATSKKYKIMNTKFQKKTARRWTWKIPNGVAKTEIDYILTNRPDIVTDVTVINQVNIASGHILVVSNIKLDVDVERKKMCDQEAINIRCHTNRIEDRIPTRIERPIRDNARTRRHRHHERKHHIYDLS